MFGLVCLSSPSLSVAIVLIVAEQRRGGGRREEQSRAEQNIHKKSTTSNVKKRPNSPGIGGIIHVIINGIQTGRARTAVLLGRTARRGLALLRRVVAVVARVVGRARVVLWVGGRKLELVGWSV